MANLTHEDYMASALVEAELGYSAPNPLVGCLIVKNGEIVGKGFHLMAGGPHAEVEALQQAGDRAFGSTAYVTLEPCAHSGRTPPCVDALIRAGVSSTYIAMLDPGLGTGGIEKLREAGVEVHVGLLGDLAREMNAIWLSQYEQKRPFVTLKVAMTMNGMIGPGIITSKASRALARKMRAQHGSVLVGAETVVTDDPLLTVRNVEMLEPPVRIILDPNRRTPATANVYTDGSAETWRVVARERAQRGDVAIPMKQGAFDLECLLLQLQEKGIPGVLVEGGSATHSHFIRQKLVDRIELFVAPRWIENGVRWEPGSEDLDLELMSTADLDGDAWLRYEVRPRTNH